MPTTGGGDLLLTDAVRNRDVEAVIRRLGQTTFDSAAEDTCRAFGMAAAWGLAEVVQLLLDAGVSPNCHDEHGVTALMLAARAGQPHMAKLLVQRGADLEARDELGQTPLFYAVQGGSVELAAVLLELGADPLVRDRKGRSPLYYAKRRPLINFNIPDWVPLIGGIYVFGLTYRIRRRSHMIEILDNAGRMRSEGRA
ncbi:MAG: ankyrin repeat domain-containing protein [Acidobacteria bacterium]|nr:ankyrin repeat domain-containing protein [Acidobacteriota bacterium]